MAASADRWDLVLHGGRVIDPESGLDAVRDVAVAAGRIAAVGTGLTDRGGRGDVDVAGQVVTAGFIDLHSHVSDLGGLRLQAMDGVTTALELEAGVTPVARAYRRAADEGRPINYGFAASWAMARMEAVGGLPPEASLGTFMARISDPAWQQPAEPMHVGALLARLAEDLADGALGIGVLLGYAPAASPAEYLSVAGLAAQAGVPTFTHARDLIEMVPATLADGADEIVRAAAETGAHMHYCHVNSTSQRHIDRVLGLVARAQAAGSRVTTEAYPYGSGMTGIGAAFLAPERLGERGLSPSSLTYAPTGERVASASRLRELRATDPGGLVIIDLLDEHDPADRALLMRSLTFPGAVVASDAMPVTWTVPPADPQAWPLPPAAITHPRTAGTFSRALRLLTREHSRALSGEGSPSRGGQLSLGQALAKCSLEPARLLQDRVPALRSKGRLQPGGDADIVVFDPDAVTDRASYRHSTRPSDGIRHVLVNGAFVVRNGDLVADARPGRPVRAEPR
ncbi:MAG TPA: amidohydrolase family protein [Streptosporangiaceae bacterium]|nr:amidohydrolase family protein [Streptosporangiaceae bacterium]